MRRAVTDRTGASSSASAAYNRGGVTGGASDLAVGLWTLVFGLAICGFLFWKNQKTQMWFEEYYLVNVMLLLLPPFLLITMAFRRELSEFGMAAGDLKRGAVLALVGFLAFIPVLWIVARTRDAQLYYLGVLLGNRPYGSGAVQGLMLTANGYVGGAIDYNRLCFHEAVLGFYMFAWEWFFRGFLLNGLRRIFPVWIAIAVQAILFCALHWSKPMPELCSSLGGGVLLGILSLRYRSFLPCFLIHWAVSAGFDFAVLYFHFHP